MREIKFRGKRVVNGGWVFGDYSRYSKDQSIIMVDLLEQEDYWVPSETVGQYTGLNDRDGVEIYEGDIVEFSHGGVVRAYVRFDNGTYDVVNEKDDVLLYLHVVNHKARIIGNIHDNPELMEASE